MNRELRIYYYYFPLLYFISTIGIALGSVISGFYIDAKWFIGESLYLILLASFLIFLIFHLVLTELYIKRSGLAFTKIYSNQVLFRAIVFLWVVSICALAINLYRALSSGVSFFGSGRKWELTFGASTIINYLYFINGFIVSSFLIVRSHLFGKFRRIHAFIFIVSLFALIFHGVKGTVLFPVLILIVSYIYVYKKLPVKPIAVLSFFIFSIFTINYLLRFGNDELNIFSFVFKNIVLYVTTSYKNLELELHRDSVLKMDFFPVSIFKDLYFSAFPDLAKILGVKKVVVDAALQDEAYNMGTIFKESYTNFGFAGFLIYPIIIAVYSFFTQLILRKGQNIFSQYLASITGVQILFLFWGNHFVRYQYWFWIILSFLLENYLRRKHATALC